MSDIEEEVVSDFAKVNSIIKSIDKAVQIEAGDRLVELLYLKEGDGLDYYLLQAVLNAKRLIFHLPMKGNSHGLPRRR
jgi:hypothetical protein